MAVIGEHECLEYHYVNSCRIMFPLSMRLLVWFFGFVCGLKYIAGCDMFHDLTGGFEVLV